jgi:membrane protein DedA with SNARE-associated domain/rhodanese-related sulfurtransferase
MSDTLTFLTHYRYGLLFLWVLAEQMGLPLPVAPLLMAVGALAGAGRMNLAVSSGLAMSAALAADLFWYHVGRANGTKALGHLCRLALEPSSCVRKDENFLGRHGARSLLMTKFIPGLNTVAPPLAGAGGTNWWRFLFFDFLGTALWVGTFETIGFAFASRVSVIVGYVAGAGKLLVGLVILGSLAGYITHKNMHRRRFLHQLRMARISPEELSQKIESGEDVTILDLRHPLDFLPQPYTIPGTIRMPMEQLERRQAEIPRDQEVIVYCTCPNEASSAMTAIKLRRYGITRVRPLEGGFHAWRDRGLPLDSEFGPPPPRNIRSKSAATN